MKKFFYFFATALVLSSCSENDIFSGDKASKTPIAIDVYSQAETRATLNDLNTLKTNGFTIAAISGTNKLIDNASASFDATASTWSYGTAANWPDNISTSVNFYGLYSAAAATLDAANGQATITVDGDNDVLAATISKSLEETTSGSVTLSFAHIMSQVVVSAKGNDTGYDYEITNVKITTDNSVIYTYSSKATAAATGATKTDFPYYAAATGARGKIVSYDASAYTAIDDTKVQILPAVESTITITYTATTGTYTSQPITKSANFTPTAGSMNRICLSLPATSTSMTIAVDDITPWSTTETTLTPSWN